MYFICMYIYTYTTHNHVLVKVEINYLLTIFENGVLLMYTLEGVNSVANFITAHEESQ